MGMFAYETVAAIHFSVGKSKNYEAICPSYLPTNLRRHWLL